ncbi:MAG: SLBB domain-containing protein [Candidatus Eisenbacteria bacterium]
MGRTMVRIVFPTLLLCVSLCSGLRGQGISRGGASPTGQTAVPPGQMPVQPSAGVLEGTLDPDQYILGAGDVLEIGFWGDVNRREIVSANPDGDILVPPIGPIRVDGLTLTQVRETIKDALAPYYTPSILSVSLVSIRTFQVHVVGMVETPGALEANGVTRASQVIGLAGGLQADGSRRNIIIRRGPDTVPVDLSSYLLLGDNSANPFLRDGDVVYVPPGPGMVYVYGSVYRPRGYEFVEGEVLGSLLDLAGGFRPEALTDEIEIHRFDTEDPTLSRAILLPVVPGELDRFEMMQGDRVFIRALPGWHEDAKVELRGEVMYPGVYVIEDGLVKLSEVIDMAGGFTEDASLAESRLIRGSYAWSTYPVERELGVIRDMEGSLEGKDGDLLKTMSRELKGAVSVSFEKVFVDDGTGHDPLLFDGDIVDVPRVSDFVRVAGHARNPGLVPLKKGEGHKYYIKQAGGFAPGADKGGTRVIKAVGGQRVRPRGEDVHPGDIIWIPAKKDRSWWDVTKDVLQMLAQIATIYLVADTVSSR